MLHVDTMQVHATYENTEVFFDPKTRKSTEMPPSIREALESQLGENLQS
jgi:acyl-CoA thioester hydrolase